MKTSTLIFSSARCDYWCTSVVVHDKNDCLERSEVE